MHMLRTISTFVLVAAAFVGGACSSGAKNADGGPDSATSACAAFEDKTLLVLTPQENALLCDCVAAKFGGYGEKVVACDGPGAGAMSTYTQHECVTLMRPLDCVTVGTLLQCAGDTAVCNANSQPCLQLQACTHGDGG
jgi:hypothetical protein